MSSYSTLFVDLDQTVYPESSGIWEDVASRIQAFLQEQLQIDEQEAIQLRLRYHREYGTTLRGLQHEGHVDPVTYMNFIHDVPIESKIQPDPLLLSILEAVSIHKFIFTNASYAHAERVLKHLGVLGKFDGIIDIISLNYVSKPHISAYLRALEIAGSPPAEASILLDDSLANLATAANLGFTTVHVGRSYDSVFTPHFQIDTIHGLLEVLPDLKDGHSPRAAAHG